jgi:hypothetical protein
MKTVLLLVSMVFYLSCTGQGVRLIAPLNENMDEMGILVKQAETSEVTVFLDPARKSKQVTMGASGGICSSAKIDVLIGSGISERLQEGFKTLFPKNQFTISDLRPKDSLVTYIEVKSVDIGFEFSPVSQGHGCNETSKMDKGRVTLVTDVQTFDQTNNEQFKKTFTYNERRESNAEQLAYRDEILEICFKKFPREAHGGRGSQCSRIRSSCSASYVNPGGLGK